MTANILRTVLLDVLLPIGAYFALVSVGLTPAWALAASAGIAVVALGVRWVRAREVSTLGLLVLVRFVLGIVVALVTGDARFVLVKDYLVTFVIALAALGTLRTARSSPGSGATSARTRRSSTSSGAPTPRSGGCTAGSPRSGSPRWSPRWSSPWRSSTRRPWRWRWSSPASSPRPSC